MEADGTGAPEAAQARRWELGWCSSDWVQPGQGMQLYWGWVRSDQPTNVAVRRITRGRNLTQLREYLQQQPKPPTAQHASEDGLESDSAVVAVDASTSVESSNTEKFDSTFQKLPNIQEDEVLQEQECLQEQMQDENNSPAARIDDAPLRRSDREPKLSHTRRQSSGNVDSSMPYGRSLSTRTDQNISTETQAGGNDDVLAVPLRRSSRERKLPHVRRESSGMVDSSILYRSFTDQDNKVSPAGIEEVDGGAAVPLLRRSGRERKLPHVRRVSSGMVDSSVLYRSKDKHSKADMELHRIAE